MAGSKVSIVLGILMIAVNNVDYINGQSPPLPIPSVLVQLLEAIFRLVTPITDALREILKEIANLLSSGEPLTVDIVIRLYAELNITSITELRPDVLAELNVYIKISVFLELEAQIPTTTPTTTTTAESTTSTQIPPTT